MPVSQLFGRVSIESTTVDTTGDQSGGISARAGIVTINSGSVITRGESSPGIDASTNGGPISIASGTIETALPFGDAIRATVSDGDGTVTIQSDRITTRGAFGSPAIFALTRGDIDIASNAITTLGNGSTAINANGGSIAVNSGTISTAGATANAIEAFAGQDVDIISGSIATAGEGSKGILARAQSGNVNIVSGQVVTRGPSGLFQPVGIDASSRGGDVSVTSGSVSTVAGGAHGISVLSVQKNVRVVSNMISTVGPFANGIFASTDAGAIAVESGTVTSGGSGIQTFVFGPGATSIKTGSITTRGPEAAGVRASSRAGAIEVRATGIIETFNPDSVGISASGSGAGPVDISSDRITTHSDRSRGIFAESASGSIVIASNAIATSGASSGGISATGTAAITIVSGSIATTGASSPGIRAVSTAGPINLTSGSITTARASNGIDVSSGLGNINVTSGSIVAQGSGSGFTEGSGIVARSTEGGNVSVVSGSVTTTAFQGFGIFATSSQGGNVSVASNTIATTGRLANAIFAAAQGGSVTVTSGPISTLGDSATGVVTFISGPGATSIRTGSITTQGFDSYGVIATSTGTGAIDVAGDGAIVTRGASSPGISAESGGEVTVSANNISTTGADSDAIAVKGSTSTVTIRGVVQSSQGFAVRGEGGLRQRAEPGGPVAVNILGGGTLRGRVSLTGGADRIVNEGTFDAVGTSQFGAGADTFDNNAGSTVRAVGGAATFAGLETFNNRGTIDLRDGAVGDSITLGGTYHGVGAALLGLDVDFGAGTADTLTTGAATGSTQIGISGTGQSFTSGILLVDAGAGTSPTAFSLADGSESPYLRNSLRFDAANNDFLLVRLPGGAVFETARFGGMATQLWQESADAVAAQLDTARDAPLRRGSGLWLQGWSGERERPGTQTLADAGTFDISYEQDFQGLQGGFDFAAGPARFGITGGAGRSDASFGATGHPVDMTARNVGLYAQLRAGPLFFNALAKRDWANFEIAPGAGLGAEFDADMLGVQANAGLRLGGGAFFAEPSVGLSWVEADLDSFESGPAAIAPGDAESLRARAGLRVGASFPLGGGALLPFAAANVYEELGGRTESDFTLGETLRLSEEPAGSRGEAAAGLSFVTAGFEAFVRAEMDFSGGSDSRAVRAGARLRF